MGRTLRKAPRRAGLHQDRARGVRVVLSGLKCVYGASTPFLLVRPRRVAARRRPGACDLNASGAPQ